MCHEAGEKDVKPQSASNILWCSPSTRTIPSADAPVCEDRVTSILACLLTIPLWRHVGILLPNSLPAYNKKVGNWTNYWCILPAFIPTLFYRQGTKSLAHKGLYLVWNSSHIWPEEWRQGGKVGMERTNRHYVRHCARPSSYIRPLNLHSSNIIIFFLHKRKRLRKVIWLVGTQTQKCLILKPCKDLLEKGMATHSSILAWRIPSTEDPGWLQSTGSQRVGHDWSDLTRRAPKTMKQSLLWVLLKNNSGSLYSFLENSMDGGTS